MEEVVLVNKQIIMTMTMTMKMKISLFDINHLNTMIRKNKAEKNNVVNEQETIQNNIKCRYRRQYLTILMTERGGRKNPTKDSGAPFHCH